MNRDDLVVSLGAGPSTKRARPPLAFAIAWGFWWHGRRAAHELAMRNDRRVALCGCERMTVPPRGQGVILLVGLLATHLRRHKSQLS